MTRLTNFVILSYSLLDDDDNLFTARGKKPCFSWLLPCKQHLFTVFFFCVISTPHFFSVMLLSSMIKTIIIILYTPSFRYQHYRHNEWV